MKKLEKLKDIKPGSSVIDFVKAATFQVCDTLESVYDSIEESIAEDDTLTEEEAESIRAKYFTEVALPCSVLQDSIAMLDVLVRYVHGLGGINTTILSEEETEFLLNMLNFDFELSANKDKEIDKDLN